MGEQNSDEWHPLGPRPLALTVGVKRSSEDSCGRAKMLSAPGEDMPMESDMSVVPASSPQYDISYEDLQKHFDKPLAQVARIFNVCTTFFKKVCRHHGIKRWPFRKLMSLEKKIRAIQESTSGGHMDNQELVMLRQKVEQIRAYKRPDLEDEVYAGGMALDTVNSRITFPDHSNNAVLSPSMSIHAELENKWQEALVTRFLGNILRKNLFAHPLSELGPMDSARFDSIRGACVFCFAM